MIEFCMHKRSRLSFILVVVVAVVALIFASDSAFRTVISLFPSMHRIGFVKEFAYNWFCSGTRRVGSLAEDAHMQNYVVKSLSGEDVPLKKYVGKVLLVVNSASR